MKHPGWFHRVGCLAVLALVGASCQTSERWHYGAADKMALESVAVTDSPGAPLVASTDSAADVPVADITTGATERVVVYQAELSLTVAGVRVTLDRLRAMATSLRGYMEEMSESAIVLRIPAARLNEAMAQAEKMGEVTKRTIKGEDLTVEVRDLDVRLRNLDEMRTRLYALLAKGTNVQELLLIEKELERVTVDIETIKGRLQAIRTDVAYSTLTVTLNTSLPQTELKEVFPFDWVRGLGQEVVPENDARYRPSQLSSTRLRLAWPPDYVKVAQRREEARAMSGDGVTILVSRHENFENGTLSFWSPVVRRWLTASRVMAVSEEQDLASGRGRLFVAVKTIGSRQFQYLVAIFAGEDYVYTYECWGAAEAVAKDRAALEKSMATLEVK